jgi:hypothetical protein
MNNLLGMSLPFIIFLLLIWILHRGKNSSPVVYDEMQTAIRGTAYKYSTITGVIGGFIASFLVNLDLIPMDGSFALVTVSFLMVTVYVVYMVVKGVYFGVSGNWKSWTLLIFLIGLCNLITGAIRIAEDGLEEGKLTSTNIGVMMGSMFLVIAAAVLIQKAREKKDENQ